MQVLIFTKEGDKVQNVPVTSITLAHDPDDPNGHRLKMLHCLNDGTPLGQYKGFVYSVFPGISPTPLPWVQRCTTCKHKYAITAIA